MRRALIAAATFGAIAVCVILGRHLLAGDGALTLPSGDASAPAPKSAAWIKSFVVDSVTGEPIDGSCLIALRLFDASEGGRLVWGPEEHPDTPVSDGWFNIALASKVAPVSLGNPPYYLELAVNGEIRSPRVEVAQLPSSFRDPAVQAPAPDGSAVRTYVRRSAQREPGFPGGTYAEISPSGAWCWFAAPRAVYHEGRYRRTYVGWVNASGDVVVAQYDHDTGAVTAAEVRDELQCDDHASPAILIRPDGRLVVFYSGHRGGWMFYRVSEHTEDVTSWGGQQIACDYTTDPFGYTYPNPILLFGEGKRTYLFWRGRDYRPMFATSEDGVVWSEPVALIGGGERPYVKICSDGNETIHFAFTDGHPRDEPSNNIHYMCYRNGGLFKADGSRIGDMRTLPVTPSRSDLVYDAAAFGARAWVWDLALDSDGNPVIVYAVFPEETDHHYRYARWNGSVWEDHEIVAAGSWFPGVERGEEHFEPHYSGGLALDHAAPSVVYLSRPVRGVFEIERWSTPDGGGTWDSETVTSGSSRNNVRPCVPRGLPAGLSCVLWMHGDYGDYTDYHTAIKIRVASAAVR